MIQSLSIVIAAVLACSGAAAAEQPGLVGRGVHQGEAANRPGRMVHVHQGKSLAVAEVRGKSAVGQRNCYRHGGLSVGACFRVSGNAAGGQESAERRRQMPSPPGFWHNGGGRARRCLPPSDFLLAPELGWGFALSGYLTSTCTRPPAWEAKQVRKRSSTLSQIGTIASAAGPLEVSTTLWAAICARVTSGS